MHKLKGNIALLLAALLLAGALWACSGGTTDSGLPQEGESIPASSQQGEEVSAKPEPTPLLTPDPADLNDRVAKTWSQFTSGKGLHLSYTMETDALVTNTTSEVHGKGGNYYALVTFPELGNTAAITWFGDGRLLNLRPDTLTGQASPAAVADSALELDPVYTMVQNAAENPESREEELTIGEESFTAVVYPKSGANPLQETFCYDGSGQLCWIISAADEETGIAEVRYHITQQDNNPDESRLQLDVSGYDIAE